MARNRVRKNNRNNKKNKIAQSQQLKPQPQPQQTPKQKQKQRQKKPAGPKPKPRSKAPIHAASDSDTPPATPTRLHSLLEPYTKPQLVDFLLDIAPSDPALLGRVRALADSDASHRRIFVYGLGWDATDADLAAAFGPFGPIDQCTVVLDKNTGRAKGFGFVLFKSRASAARALREPQKRIGSRVASCQLASMGRVRYEYDTGRKIYISNVSPETNLDRLTEFFNKFGEIEGGPFGFDKVTGRARGYAMFVYKTLEDAKRALEEPYKVFEGQLLHCKLATPSAADGQKRPMPPSVLVQAATAVPAAAAGVSPQQQQQQLLAAMAAAQNLALWGQNPAYAALLAQNPLLAAAALNPGLAAYGGGITDASALGAVAGMQYGGGVHSMLGGYTAGQPTVGVQGLAGYQAGSSYQAGQLSDAKDGGVVGGFGYDVMKQNR